MTEHGCSPLIMLMVAVYLQTIQILKTVGSLYFITFLNYKAQLRIEW